VLPGYSFDKQARTPFTDVPGPEESSLQFTAIDMQYFCFESEKTTIKTPGPRSAQIKIFFPGFQPDD